MLRADPDLGSFSMSPDALDRMRRAPPSDAHRAFFETSERPVHKWEHYLGIYDRYLSRYRNGPVKLLEIGVLEGGSLDMWRRYLGAEATIVGVDINPACAGRVDPPNHVRIGSQADPGFLTGIVEEFGTPDVILDDGSHIARHQQASFDVLFPLLADGGLYLIEDAHTSYWNDWDGGYRRRGTAIEQAKTLIDDLHGWYHHRPNRSGAHEQIDSIHFHDSVIIIEKRQHGRPGQMSSVARGAPRLGDANA